MEAQKFYIGWEEFHRDTKELCVKIKQKGEFNRIIAVSRGGLIPAGILAYELDIRWVDSLNVRSYDGNERRQDEDVEIFGAEPDNSENILVVDDLSDSGRTIRILRKFYPNACFVSIYTKQNGAALTDIYSRLLPDNWIIFPWD